MSKEKISKLDVLEQDIWFNFCYNYKCDELNMIEDTYSQAYKDSIGKIILSLQVNDFLVNEHITYLAELIGETFSVPFKPIQIAELLKRIQELRQDVDHISAHLFQRQYSDILIAYVDTLGKPDAIENKNLARSAKATLAVKARYDKHLYPRREIIYRILREQVALRGKWKTLNEAIHFIVDDLVKAFEVYDLEWLQSELILKQKMLGELEQSKPSVKRDKADLDGIRRKPKTASTSKKIVELKKELINLKKILNSKYPSKEMEKFGYKMPYSGGYIAETIIHELRTQPTIRSEIIL